MNKHLWLVPVGLISTLLSCSESSAPRVVDGRIDLRNWTFEQAVELRGGWHFLPGEEGERRTVELPSAWNDWTWKGKDAGSPDGYGRFFVRLSLPEPPRAYSLRLAPVGSALSILRNGQEVYSSGVVSIDPRQTRPGLVFGLADLGQLSGEVSLQFTLSNVHHVDGGLWSVPELGPTALIEKKHSSSLSLDWFVAGCIFAMGFYHMSLAYFWRRGSGPLLYGLFALIIGVRVLFHGELASLELWPFWDWEWFQKIRHWTFYLAVPPFMAFMASLHPTRYPFPLKLSFVFVSGLFALAVLVLPYRVFAGFLPLFELYVLFLGLWIIVVLVREFPKGKAAVWLLFTGFGLFFATMVNDIAKALWVLPIHELFPYGLLAFLFFQSLVMAKDIGASFHKQAELTREVQHANKILTKFLPVEFLQTLKKSSFLDISLGEAAKTEMAVLFCDIRDFTSYAQHKAPEEIFRFLNEYLGLVGPVIRAHGGFVDKYFGDGLMALFPEGSQSAVDAALKMLMTVQVWNTERLGLGEQEIRLGIGIHRGPLVLGTVGEKERMDGTVVSAAVNLASRLESLTKKFGAQILVSVEVIMDLPMGSPIHFRSMGLQSVRGLADPIPVFEIFEGDDEQLRTQKEISKNEFEDALVLFTQWKLKSAARAFAKLSAAFPMDKAVRNFYRRIRRTRERFLAARLLARARTHRKD